MGDCRIDNDGILMMETKIIIWVRVRGT